MSTPNNLSITIPQTVLDACMINAQNIIANLEPYLQGLTDEERHDIYKLGDKSVGYFQKLVGYLDSAPEYIPPYMDAAEFKKDAAVVIALQPLYQTLDSLFRKIEDTRMIAGSEAMSAGKAYYGTVSVAAKNGAPGAQAVYNDLQARFPGRKGGNVKTHATGGQAGQ